MDERHMTTGGSFKLMYTTLRHFKMSIIVFPSLLLSSWSSIPTVAASFLINDHLPHRSLTISHRALFHATHPVSSPLTTPPTPTSRLTNTNLRMGFLDDLFQNVDDFIDDATNRKLGGGSTFYGERKSSFSSTSKSYSSISKNEADKRDMARIGSNSNLNPLRRMTAGRLTGEQLRNLVYQKWGQRFPVLIKRKRDALGQQRLYMIVQWKYLGKRNLQLSPEEYVAESDAVAELLTEWGVANQVRNEIGDSTARPKTATQQFPGLFIALDVEEDVVETW